MCPTFSWLWNINIFPFRLHFHNACRDPLGWTKNPALTVQQFTVEELALLLKQTSHPKPATLVIDSLSWILRHHKPLAVCRTLQQLRKGNKLSSKYMYIGCCNCGLEWRKGQHPGCVPVCSLGGAVRAIVGLLHADMHPRGTVGSLCHLATSVITVVAGVKGDEAVVKITKRSKSGKVAQDVSNFFLSEDSFPMAWKMRIWIRCCLILWLNENWDLL